MIKDNLSNFKELISALKEEQSLSSFPAHYGMKDEDFVELKKDILIKLIKFGEYSKVLDDVFSNLKSDDKLKIHAYMQACKYHALLEGKPL